MVGGTISNLVSHGAITTPCTPGRGFSARTEWALYQPRYFWQRKSGGGDKGCRKYRCRSSSSSGGDDVPAAPGGGGPINEDLIARLRAAEEEAQKLKKELAEAQAKMETSSSDQMPPKTAPSSRIDGGDLRRETLDFVESKPRNWLSEADVEFFTGGGPSEAAEGTGVSEAEAAEVRRRLILGLGLAVAVGGFALVPTEKLQAPPAKPLFFYLVPLLRVRALLQEAQSIIPVGDYEQLRVLLSRIEGPPNNVQENLRNAAASLSSSRDAEAAEYVARDVYEYIKNIDYQTYYDTPNKSSKELFTFSQKSAAAADSKLKEFLSLMPKDQVEAAQEQIAATAMAL